MQGALDTHALIWAIDGSRKRLGNRARKPFNDADEGKCAVYIPAIALAELGEACHRDRVILALPIEEWARAAFASGRLTLRKRLARIRSAILCLSSAMRRMEAVRRASQ
jgi:PIN domain nuclease of toxin-antitoxin system